MLTKQKDLILQRVMGIFSRISVFTDFFINTIFFMCYLSLLLYSISAILFLKFKGNSRNPAAPANTCMIESGKTIDVPLLKFSLKTLKKHLFKA